MQLIPQLKCDTRKCYHCKLCQIRLLHMRWIKQLYTSQEMWISWRSGNNTLPMSVLKFVMLFIAIVCPWYLIPRPFPCFSMHTRKSWSILLCNDYVQYVSVTISAMVCRNGGRYVDITKPTRPSRFSRVCWKDLERPGYKAMPKVLKWCR